MFKNFKVSEEQIFGFFNCDVELQPLHVLDDKILTQPLVSV